MKPLLVLAFVPSLLAGLPAQAPCHDLQAVAAVQQDLLAALPFSGSSVVRIAQRGAIAYEQATGTFTPQTVVPIASATKTLSAAVLLSLVDDGILTLDDPVGLWLPEWNVGAKAAITLRMCFTHTSGLPGSDPLLGDDSVTLRAAALQLAARPLQFTPGTAFAYGGVSMHVAGAVCEVATGQPWAQLFAQRIAQPLGMTATDYEAFGPTPNPRIAGGAQSNVPDFAAFVEMLRRGGSHGGVTVLSPQSVATMLSDQTSALPIVSTPHPDAAPYGVGIWLERRDANGATLLAHANGAFGFLGWVDRAHDASGVFQVRSSNQLTLPFVEAIWRIADDALLPDGVACLGAASPACASAAWLNGSVGARAGTDDFALLLARAPANALGAVLIGDPLPAGVPFVDLVAFVGPVAPVFATVLSDAAGRASVPASLAATAPGDVVGLQALWLTAEPCASLALQASHAITLTIQP